MSVTTTENIPCDPILPADGEIGSLILSRYCIRKKIGSGAYGNVYEAQDVMLGQSCVALKLFSEKSLAHSQVRSRIFRELKILFKIRHDHIVQLYEPILDEKRVGYTMELVRGNSLQDLIAEKTHISITDVFSILSQVLRGISALHTEGFVHRDIKPANVLLTHDGIIKVGDLGLAVRVEETEQLSKEDFDDELLLPGAVTQCGHFIGTAAYCSPEQAFGAPASFQSDLYSIGVIAYELITGKLPVEGKTRNELFHNKMRVTAAPVSTLRHELPIGVDQFISKLINPDPLERYQSCEEALKDLSILIRFETSHEKLSNLNIKALQTSTLIKTRMNNNKIKILLLSLVIFGILWLYLTGESYEFKLISNVIDDLLYPPSARAFSPKVSVSEFLK